MSGDLEKGFKLGMGAILAIVLVFVVLPLMLCAGFFGLGFVL